MSYGNKFNKQWLDLVKEGEKLIPTVAKMVAEIPDATDQEIVRRQFRIETGVFREDVVLGRFPSLRNLYDIALLAQDLAHA